MSAIDLLMDEHRRIEKALDALDVYAARVAQAAGADRAHLARFVQFVRVLADARHHGKEENILFASMVSHGFPREGGPVAVMLAEHDEGRAYIAALDDAGGRAEWSDADRAAIARAAGGYTALLRQHIRKEDGILYPMARMHLPAPAMDRVDEQSERFEAEWRAAGKPDWADFADLLAAYAPGTAATAR